MHARVEEKKTHQRNLCVCIDICNIYKKEEDVCVRTHSIKMEYHFIKGRCRRRERKKRAYEREKFVCGIDISAILL